MLKGRSIDQMLELLSHVKRKSQSGYPVKKAYQEAVDKISTKYNVTYQTIGDLCCRRQALSGIDVFINMLEGWINGNPEKLRQLLLGNSDTPCQQQIIQFFNNEMQGVTTEPHSKRQLPIEEYENFSVRLHKEQAKKLKVLTVMSELSIHEKLAGYMENKIEEEFSSWLKSQMNKNPS